MRFYMVQGEVTSAEGGGPLRGVEPEAVFCASSTQHHTGWVRLTAHAIHARIWERNFEEITMAEYERALAAIDKHRAWQAEVARRRGNSDPRPRVGRRRKEHPAIKVDGDVGQQQQMEAGPVGEPARAPASAGDGDSAPAHGCGD